MMISGILFLVPDVKFAPEPGAASLLGCVDDDMPINVLLRGIQMDGIVLVGAAEIANVSTEDGEECALVQNSLPL
jgi:hypothetical protein